MAPKTHRRGFLAGGLALAACDGRAATAEAPVDLASLKAGVGFPVGTCAMTNQLDDPRWAHVCATHFSQITPEWELKMERVLQADGTYDFSAADRLADWAVGQGMRFHATTMIWYAQEHPWFEGLSGDRFGAEYDRWVRTLGERYRGVASGWDTVNEPVAEDGDGLRDCLWSRRLGQDGYMIRAFQVAHEADPEAVHFINDYNLENNPVKGATFLRLVERLLKAGAPIGGLGTQSHLDIEIPAGRIREIVRELGRFGLPVHVSELDASLRREGLGDMRSAEQRMRQQHARVMELAEAFVELPAAQRYAFTAWGVRDTDSWLRRGERDDGQDQPLLFDADGDPKPLARDLHAILSTA